MSLTLRGLAIVSPSEVCISFIEDGPEGQATVSYIFHVLPGHGDALACHAEKAFTQRYRGAAGHVVPLWPERLAIAAMHAYKQPLPDRTTMDAATPEYCAELRDGCQGV